ncbi:hypothetical protein [Pseudomonas sp. PB106]|uniref:hypothetical protein n=1 Tax=Pseudomonas sp. PB106 TaxID=2494699 RepID=UPI00131D5C8E|nr:hypothetical protein [Pseudomonas sp. PB106]KAE9645518.1 hypothetical protein EJA71_11375 [Pseudomonas sp. PB106]
MSINSNKNASFLANLFLEGRPVVLNQQRLKSRLRDPRLTRRERLDTEVSLASGEGVNYLTLADHEDDKPLLFKFVPKDNGFAVMTILKGEYDERFLSVAQGTRHVVAGDDRNNLFSLSNGKTTAANFTDLQKGPSYVHLGVAGRLLYLGLEGGKHYFKDADPNATGHDAFNGTPAVFVLKIVAQSE